MLTAFRRRPVKVSSCTSVITIMTVLSCSHFSGGRLADPPAILSFDRTLLLEQTSETSANVSIGDVNGDGYLDLVLVKGRHWPLHNVVLMGDSSGSFLPPRTLSDLPDRSYSGELIDLDRDGDLDIVVSNDAPDAKLVYMNDGSGTFVRGSSFGKPKWPTRHVTVADLNGDGQPDIILANRSGNDNAFNYVCFGTGNNRFDDCRGFSNESATTIAVADFNGDGLLDLLVPHREGGQSQIYLNDATASFERRVPFASADAAVRSAKAADFDGDGAMDVVVIDEKKGPLVYFGRKNLAFDPAIRLGDPGATPYALAVYDLNRDGRSDIIVGNVSAPSVAYFNAADRTFSAVSFGDGNGIAYGFAFGDTNRDGYTDIALARSGAPNVLYFGSRGF